jgi:excinuclease ABC subunit C
MLMTASITIKTLLNALPTRSGVYRFLDKDGEVLYVGKAQELRKRVASYFKQTEHLSPKTQALVKHIAHIEVTVTQTESEALILENTLIKTYQPRYNILLRDDKSYPFLHLSEHPFPRLSFYRGARQMPGRYFGPYPHAQAAYESLRLLQKLFPVRQCRDSFFRHRSRPCLQYQIKRCSAPCVGLIDPAHYQEDVQHTVMFLEGKSPTTISALIKKMQIASRAMDFEKAALYRDQIKRLRQLQKQQHVCTEGGNVDIVVSVMQNNMGCVQVLTIRDGRQLSNPVFFPKHTQEVDEVALLSAFLPQYYLSANQEIPDEIILNQIIPDLAVLTTTLSQQQARKIRIHTAERGEKARWLEMALENAQANLVQYQPRRYQERLSILSDALGLGTLPQRIECFDVSHTLGEATVAACVVFDSDGACPSAYRRFNIEHIQAGDDCAALRQALMRRYKRLQKEAVTFPDVVLIDGGIAQVNVAQTVLSDYALTDVHIIGVAKGITRKAGLETLILYGVEQPLILATDSPARHLIQQIRDEAHRFAITAHRKQRAKARNTSVLEQIEGIGVKRRQQLINYFGGLQGITKASVEELSQVPGISRQLAQKIYDFFLTT